MRAPASPGQPRRARCPARRDPDVPHAPGPCGVVGGVVFWPKRDQSEAGPDKLERHDEIGWHETSFAHDCANNRVGSPILTNILPMLAPVNRPLSASTQD